MNTFLSRQFCYEEVQVKIRLTNATPDGIFHYGFPIPLTKSPHHIICNVADMDVYKNLFSEMREKDCLSELKTLTVMLPSVFQDDVLRFVINF